MGIGTLAPTTGEDRDTPPNPAVRDIRPDHDQNQWLQRVQV
jgi:hypothetical protein